MAHLGHYCRVRNVLRTAFLVYVRVLLCLQGMFLGFWAWALWPLERQPRSLPWKPPPTAS